MENKEFFPAIKALYTDKTGKFNPDLLNKDLIKFAHTSSRVRKMTADKESAEDIRNYVIAMKFRNLLGNKMLTDEEVLAVAEALDAESERSIFKALNEDIRQRLNAGKKGNRRK